MHNTPIIPTNKQCALSIYELTIKIKIQVKHAAVSRITVSNCIIITINFRRYFELFKGCQSPFGQILLSQKLPNQRPYCQRTLNSENQNIYIFIYIRYSPNFPFHKETNRKLKKSYLHYFIEARLVEEPLQPISSHV